ncbi:MAG TPA: MG2 domain-containing protein [Gammaproteobacteria bacterium]|mgnify:CR=1 FL=1|nr:MG2 domain-containing protein [Gammaproteobacteria bacterium]
MRGALLSGFILWLLCMFTSAASADARVERFSPSGSVKGVRQVQVRFSEAMVSFGDPRAPTPFTIDCPVGGRSRWVDARNWVHDFDADLPGGITCRFTLKPTLRSATGAPLAGERRYGFDTGGPAILASEPWEGAQIDEEQIFLLGLDAAATRASIEAGVHCRVDGINEAIGVEVLDGDARREALAASPWFLRRYAAAVRKGRYEEDMVARTPDQEAAVRARYEALVDGPDSAIVALRCRQRLPNAAKMWLDWGPGLATVQGLVGTESLAYAFEVRPVFRASFGCERVNRGAQCMPALGMRLSFSAPVARETLAKIAVTDAGGRAYAVSVDGSEDDASAQGLRVAGPLPPRTHFKVTLPSDLADDAGRPLANAERFPLEVATDEDPPLAKFAARFGIVELAGDATLPVTVRNLEPNILRRPPPPPRKIEPTVGGFVRDLTARALDLERDTGEAPLAVASIRGRVLKIDAADTAEVGRWFDAVERAGRDEYAWDEARSEYVTTQRAGSVEVLQKAREARLLEVPRAAPAKAFEVIGIPLREPGFYVVELASPRLGESLFGKPGTYYVQSLALVTNLGVHLKLGRESSLVWVTALDTGKPVAGAEVTIKDCAGHTQWSGTSDAAGIAAVELALPEASARPACAWSSRGLVAIARLGKDTGFVSSEWQNGIATWQFGLPAPANPAPRLVSTVFDRTLFRSGETVHMKHLMREHTTQGFVQWSPATTRLRVRHEGSGDEFPLSLDPAATTGSATSSWRIPASAKLGSYVVELADGERWLAAGSFRVESFRVPLLRAELQPRDLPRVRAKSLALDLQVNYLAGGPAAELPVNLRGVIEARTVSFADYPEFGFMTGNVEEGSATSVEQPWRATETDESRPEPLGTQRAVLDAAGGARLTLELPDSDRPRTLLADLEYPDPNGEILTAATRVPLWPSRIVLGLKPEGWALSRQDLAFKVLALDLDGKPRAGVEIGVDLLQRNTYSHRKRLVGGFYAYEHRTEVKKLGLLCNGRTDAQGLLLCRGKSPASGNLILVAHATDAEGHASHTHRDVWVAGDEDWWYAVGDHDRMDLIPERKRYEPGETARLQVRMPFRAAQALVTVEREGIVDAFVTALSGKSPVVEIPLRGEHAPNVFVSVLAVRGRDQAVQPTALVDLGRPAYKLGMAELKVGWRTHELQVKVQPERSVYRVREEAAIDLEVARADGKPLGADAEIALAAVDEGLLELRANDSWDLLAAMMGQRGIEVQTATAQMQVVGRRHYGRKAVAPGGGGGSGGASRTLFDTLLTWQPRVKLDAQGRARVTVPLNDSLTGFRIAAVATAGAGHFGTGMATIRTTRDLMLFSGLPPVVRAGDRYRAAFTVRNAGDAPLTATVDAALATSGGAPLPALAPQTFELAPVASREIAWELTAPDAGAALHWQVTARSGEDAAATDRLEVTQRVAAALPVRTVQATLTQLRAPLALPLVRPAGALDGGGIAVKLDASLAASLDGVTRYMREYPYRCLEQRVSRAIVLGEDAAWSALMDELPGYLDADGLAKYFPTPAPGSEVLSTYLLAIAAADGRAIPDSTRQRLRQGLVSFIEGRLDRESKLATADLALRKLAAIEALSRYPEGVQTDWLDSLDLAPKLWPTSAVIDWIDLLQRLADYPAREARLGEALGILRARLDLQGTRLGFSTEDGDALWWLMLSADVNANRALLAVLERADWAEDVPRLVTGSLQRQREGHWDTTTANAWGMVAMRAFARRYEAAAVGGRTQAALASEQWTADWAAAAPREHLFAWPQAPAALNITHAGTGAPWVSVQSRAAIPLRAPLFAGFAIARTVIPVRQRTPGIWQRGDVYRVRLDVDAQSEMTWVVVEDPLPAGATALGGGLGRGSDAAAAASYGAAAVTPVFEERRQDVFRAYYDYVPKGGFTLEYSVRLNNAGELQLPPTRVEALYAPEMYGELPNAPLSVRP